MEKIILRDFYGKITGYIEVKDNGDKTLRDFYGVIKGYYKKSDDTTRDFYMRVVARGDQLTTLLDGKR